MERCRCRSLRLAHDPGRGVELSNVARLCGCDVVTLEPETLTVGTPETLVHRISLYSCTTAQQRNRTTAQRQNAVTEAATPRYAVNKTV